MKFTTEITHPEYVEVDANSEEEAINKVKESIQDKRLQDFITLKVYKEVVINS